MPLTAMESIFIILLCDVGMKVSYFDAGEHARWHEQVYITVLFTWAVSQNL